MTPDLPQPPEETSLSEGIKRRDRQVFRVADVPDDLLAAIEDTEPPPESYAVERELAAKTRAPAPKLVGVKDDDRHK